MPGFVVSGFPRRVTQLASLYLFLREHCVETLAYFPRSLRQLVMMAFLLILLPLLVLARQAWQSLNALSARWHCKPTVQHLLMRVAAKP